MHQYDHPTGVAVQPTPSAPGTPGFMRDGDAGLGVAPSIWTSELANSMMMEIINAVEGAGLTLDKEDDAQLYAAIIAIATSVAGGAAGSPGDIKMRAYPTVPSGWLHCDGAAVSRTTYAALFAVIGTTYGPGNGTTTFNLPDFDDRFPVGANGGSRVVGVYSASNVGAHTHGAGYIDTEGRSDGGNNMLVPSNTGGFAPFSTDSAGSGDTEPKSVAVMFVIKT